MKVKDLLVNIQETLGLDAITTQSLIVCINNCISILHSKEYRHFVETTTNITNPALPIDLAIPTDKKELIFVKVETPKGIFLAKRIALTKEHLQTRVVDGKFRLDSKEYPFVYYETNSEIIIDSYQEWEISKVHIGYFKKIPKLPLNTSKEEIFGEDPLEIEVREEFEDAFTFYGLIFFSNRVKFRPEVTEQYNQNFRYFIEDMSNQLDKEDMFIYQIETKDVVKL